MDENQKQIEQRDNDNSKTANKSTSLGTLITWNIYKALERSPHIDLKCAIRAAQARLERDVNTMMSQCPEERHLECALLAWQQLGHNNADSLYKFYEKKKIEEKCKAGMCANRVNDYLNILDIKPEVKQEINKETKPSMSNDTAAFSSYSMGPVVKLPVEPKVVMRIEDSGTVRPTCKKPKTDERNIMNKLDALCCMDSKCIERLSTLDATTSELRLRAAKLAQREAERAELLERAEAAWKNLELGYHRRLTLAEEKEEDISKQIQKLLEERNNYKAVCTTLVQQLKVRGEAAEKERGKLTEVEKTVYDHACGRLRLSEQVAKEESALAEQHCKGAQMDRDLQLKEEEARRKLRTAENELESTRVLTYDTERAMREELGALKEQVSRVSKQLLAEDADSSSIKQELQELQLEKMGMVEDLDGCKLMCEKRMQGQLDELKMKKQQLNELNDKVFECRCKFPIDVTVEVKRTASLAALCRCTPEDKVLESCSCTSLRSQLLSNLLADLFGGLLTELGWTGSQMPCQLLKCLEDKHNWDYPSVIKTNLRSFFTRLLIGELDIAIATSIEKYHAKWVGGTCADEARLIPDTCEADNTSWQERAVELRAQKLATKLAEQLFKERADQLTQRAKEFVHSCPPPCECGTQSVLYPCILKPPQPISIASSRRVEGISPKWRRTLSDVTQLRLQVDSHKKDSIKKTNLTIMEETTAKLVERNSVQHNIDASNPDVDKNTIKRPKPINLDYSSSNKKSAFINSPKKGNKTICKTRNQMDKSTKSYNKLKQTFAVNLCLCGTQTGLNKKNQQDKHLQDTNIVDNISNNYGKQKSSNAPVTPLRDMKRTKPINIQIMTTEISNRKLSKTTPKIICTKDCACFHKNPSNTSIDKLLRTVTKWKNDLIRPSVSQDENFNIKQNSSISSENIKNQNSLIASGKLMNQNSLIVSEKLKNQNSVIASEKIMNQNSLIATEKIIHEKRSSKASCTFDQETENMRIKNITKSASIDNNKFSKGQIEEPEVLQVIPKATESEYIGAVNLDKSNVSMCKCENNGDKNNYTCDVRHKCASSLKESEDKKSFTQTSNLSAKSLHTESMIRGKDVSGSKNKIKSTKSQISMEDGDPNQMKHSFPTDTSNKSNEICDCDITLLGVTIADKKSKKRKKTHDNNGGYSDNDYDTNDCNGSHRFKNNQKMKPGRFGKTSKNTYLDECTITSNRPSTCTCPDNYNKMKDFTVGMCNNPKNIFLLNVNEGLDDVETEKKEEACICCNINNAVETKNLEENMFHLLKEHLKEKLDEFKANSCKFSCIPVEEEEKLFSTLIHKVKQIVIDTTNDISCRCASKLPTDGSWNRAYSLLQEYLKAKIKRVQCHCKSKEDKSSIGDVIDKVGKLIEQDFDRLKSICKCKNTSQIQVINAVSHVLSEEEIPVKDVYKPQVHCQSYKDGMQITYNSVGVPTIDEGSLKSVILTENMSSQVPLNLGMESKSCNAIEKGSVNIQTSEIETIYNEHGSTVSKSHYYCCCNVYRKECVPALELGATKVFVNHCTKLGQEHDVKRVPKYAINCKSYSYPGLDSQRFTFRATENNQTGKINNETNTCDENFNTDKTTHLPYIGYTVDCSCDRNIGACVCMKSVVQANNNKFVDMWKRYNDYNKTRLEKVSYIMKGASFEPTIIIDRNPEATKIQYNAIVDHNLKRKVCEVKLSTHGDVNIILKESRNNIGGVHSAACALTQSFNRETNYCIDKDSLDWCECSSRPGNTPNTDDYDKTIDSHVSSDILVEDLGDDVAINQLPKNCNCDVVPICHVKMLVENIENKLIQSRCTCESLMSFVCPIHSSGFF